MNVVKVQTRGGFIKQKQNAFVACPGFFAGGHFTFSGSSRWQFSQMSGQLQALGFTTTQGRYRLSQLQVVQTHINQWLQTMFNVFVTFKKHKGFFDCQVQHISNRQCACIVGRIQQGNIEYFAAITFAVTFAATQVNIAEELHLHMFKTITRTNRATTIARVKTESAGGISAFFGQWLVYKTFTDNIKGTHIRRRYRACGFTERTLIHKHNVGQLLLAADAVMRAGCFGSNAEMAAQSAI